MDESERKPGVSRSGSYKRRNGPRDLARGGFERSSGVSLKSNRDFVSPGS